MKLNKTQAELMSDAADNESRYGEAYFVVLTYYKGASNSAAYGKRRKAAAEKLEFLGLATLDKVKRYSETSYGFTTYFTERVYKLSNAV